MANNEEHGFFFPFDIPYSYVISKTNKQLLGLMAKHQNGLKSRKVSIKAASCLQTSLRQVYEDENRTKFDTLIIGGDEIPELRYADDTTLLSSTASGLEKTIMSVKSHSESQTKPKQRQRLQ